MGKGDLIKQLLKTKVILSGQPEKAKLYLHLESELGVHHLHHYAPMGIQVLHPSHVTCRLCLISAAESGEHSDYHIPLSTIFHTMDRSCLQDSTG
ncbi:hypothetical protein VNO80_02079 [Phaseolus coccineus]|uniref:Uncharacterized protein n=1 Tax=Phaseolus coccineus TaxID=3886 RepID=A0AAN9NP06_PHACN